VDYHTSLLDSYRFILGDSQAQNRIDKVKHLACTVLVLVPVLYLLCWVPHKVSDSCCISSSNECCTTSTNMLRSCWVLRVLTGIHMTRTYDSALNRSQSSRAGRPVNLLCSMPPFSWQYRKSVAPLGRNDAVTAPPVAWQGKASQCVAGR